MPVGNTSSRQRERQWTLFLQHMQPLFSIPRELYFKAYMCGVKHYHKSPCYPVPKNMDGKEAPMGSGYLYGPHYLQLKHLIKNSCDVAARKDVKDDVNARETIFPALLSVHVGVDCVKARKEFMMNRWKVNCCTWTK